VTLVDQSSQIAVRSGDDSDVDTNHLLPADGTELALLQGAEELALHPQAHVPNLIEKERPPVGEL
jgi:hypothetical protein